MTDGTLWLGRAKLGGEGRARCVAVWTQGLPPGPEDLAEEIEDPFGESDSGGAPIPGGFRGPVRELVCEVPVRPGKILGVGRNYPLHAAEMGSAPPTEPLLFLKPSSALVTDGAPIVLPSGFERIDMEAELVVVIGRRARGLTPRDALSAVFGYALGNDVTCRDLQRSDGQWARAKGFDTFAPLSPWIRGVPPGVSLPSTARIRGYYGEVLRQDAAIEQMVFSIAEILVHASACMTLFPGDLVFTGTPDGVTPLQPGGIARVEFDGLPLAPLTNPVVAGTMNAI